ncbi:MAG: fibronectin type III domain-containing protein [Actinobacteria bacterium]|nr:fibronectin type III domain-containing protein [Actinomycetota bacterium]
MFDAASDFKRSEGGFTMVELMVSLTILAIGIVGVVGVFNSSFSVAAGASARSKAVSLATREIEAFRAKKYSDVVVSSTTTTVTEQIGGLTYTIEKAVTWLNEASVNQAYKQATVAVSWTDGAGLHQVHQSTILYPGGLGTFTSSSNTVTSSSNAPPAPLTLAAAVPAGDDGQTAADLAWTMPTTGLELVHQFVVQYSTNSFATPHEVTDTVPAAARSLRVTGLSAGTTYSFRVASKSPVGTRSAWSPTASATTAGTSLTECSIGTPAVTPAKIERKSANDGAGLVSNPIFSVNTSGSCSGLSIKYKPTMTTSRTLVLSSSSSGLFTGQLDGTTTAWDVGPHTIELFDSLTVKRGQVVLTVCDRNARDCL